MDSPSGNQLEPQPEKPNETEGENETTPLPPPVTTTPETQTSPEEHPQHPEQPPLTPDTSEGEDEEDQDLHAWYRDDDYDEDDDKNEPVVESKPKRKSRRSKSTVAFRTVSDRLYGKKKDKPRESFVSSMNLKRACDFVPDFNQALMELYSCPVAGAEVVVPTVKLELAREVDFSKTQDPLKKWVCRPEIEKASKRVLEKKKGSIVVGNLLIHKLEKKAKEAMALLMQKMEMGLLPLSWEQVCYHPLPFQHGIDETPTPSKCHIPIQPTGTDSTYNYNQSVYKTKEMIQLEISKYLHEQIALNKAHAPGTLSRSNSAFEWIMEDDKSKAGGGKDSYTSEEYCQITDIHIEKYLDNFTAQYLLRSAGALDDHGDLLCDFNDFNKVEHLVKTLLIQVAKNYIDEMDRKEELTKQSEIFASPAIKPTPSNMSTITATGVNKPSTSPFPDSFFIKMNKRKKMKEVILNRLKECCPSLVPPERTIMKKAQIFRVSLPEKTNGNRTRSVSRLRAEKAKSVAGRLQKNLFVESEDEMVELLPYEYRDSFETDEGSSFEYAARRHSIESRTEYLETLNLENKAPIRAEMNTFLMPRNPKLCYPEDAHLTAKNFREWKSLKKLQDLEQTPPTEGPEREDYLQLKYFILWLQTIRKRRNHRSYFPDQDITNDEKDSHMLFQPLWKGPYSPYVLKCLRTTVPGMENFSPTSLDDFYRAVRKMEAQMFERSRQLVKDFDKEEEEAEAEEGSGTGAAGISGDEGQSETHDITVTVTEDDTGVADGGGVSPPRPGSPSLLNKDMIGGSGKPKKKSKGKDNDGQKVPLPSYLTKEYPIQYRQPTSALDLNIDLDASSSNISFTSSVGSFIAANPSVVDMDASSSVDDKSSEGPSSVSTPGGRAVEAYQDAL